MSMLQPPLLQPGSGALPRPALPAVPSRAEWALAAGALALLALAALLPATALPAGYHDFADQRPWLGLPNAMDVLTNLAFVGMGGWLLLALRRSARALCAARRGLMLLLGLGMVAAGLASGYYHLRPDDAGLAIDRLGMVHAFAGVLGLAVAERISSRAGVATAAAVLALAPLSVLLAWQPGNMTPWSLLQAGGLLLLLLLPLGRLQAGALGFSTLAIVLWYALAKGLEMADAPVLALSQGVISGHSAKHFVAAWAVWPVIAALRARHNARPHARSAA